MAYMLQQKIFKLSKQFSIKNADGVEVLHVQGKIFDFGDRLRVTDQEGQEVATIVKRLFSLPTRHEIRRPGLTTVDVVRKLSLFRPRYYIEPRGEERYEIEGDLFSHEYVITRHGGVVATVSKEFWSWTDTYGVDIGDGEDHLMLLCSAVVIDLVCHRRSNR